MNATQAEELLRELKQNDPALFNRIASLRDGVRSARKAATQGYVVFCEASSEMDGSRRYQQLFHVDSSGNVVTRDLQKVLRLLACPPDETTLRIPKELNEHVMKTRRLFAEEVKHRESELEHSVTLGHAQKYVLRELRTLFTASEDESVKGQINLLEQVFRHPLTDAVRRELNQLRRSHMAGKPLIEALKRVYQRHGLSRWTATAQGLTRNTAARVVCSEALSL